MTLRRLVFSASRHARRSRTSARIGIELVELRHTCSDDDRQGGSRHLSSTGLAGPAILRGSDALAITSGSGPDWRWTLPRTSVALLGAPAGMSTQAMQPERAYARDVLEYNQVLLQLSRRKRAYMIREAYDDMLMDGITPNRDTFHIAIPGCMKAKRLQDAFYFFQEMKSLGLQPDVVLYNCLISTCGRCFQVDKAFQVAEEMEAAGIAPKLRTFVALLNACGIAGRVNEAWGVVQRMTMYGCTLNSFCYGALINAYKNRRPLLQETPDKIMELLEESRGKRVTDDPALTLTLGEEGDAIEMEEEMMYDGGRRMPYQRELVVFHAALRAMVDLRNYEGALQVVRKIEEQGLAPDGFTYMQLVRAHLDKGLLDRAMDAFDHFVGLGLSPPLELYMTMIEGAILKYSPEGMAMARRLLVEFKQRGFFLNPRYGGQLLSLAAKDRYGSYEVACMVFDMVREQPLQRPPFQATLLFLKGLVARQTSQDDPRLKAARAIIEFREEERRTYFDGKARAAEGRASGPPASSEEGEEDGSQEGSEEREEGGEEEEDAEEGETPREPLEAPETESGGSRVHASQ